jgi:Tfp pilus assembly protein PilO
MLPNRNRAIPLRLTLAGEFRGIAAFLRGIETRERLYTVEEFSLRRDSRGTGKAVLADLSLAVYTATAGLPDFDESDENSASSLSATADTQDVLW